jgi:hypothetical protein
MPEQRPYWRLISVLFSAFPLTPALAMALYEAAARLHAEGGEKGDLSVQGLVGRVRNLKREVLLGSIGGAEFEADVESEERSGRVRFLVTREGLEQSEAPLPQMPALPKRLMN